MKKITSIFAVLLISTLILSACGKRVAKNPSEGLEFTSNGDGTCYVSGIGTCTDTDIIIPSVSPAGDSVTSIGSEAFLNCDSLNSVIIPDSVTSIENNAFNATSLTNVTIPDSVTSIGHAAFASCPFLKSISIPGNVTSIGWDAFAGFVELTSITVAKGNPVYHSAGNCLIETATKTLIAGCKNSIIPDDGSVTSIESNAFFLCQSLTSISIPNSVTSIGIDAFTGCASLESITVAAGNPVYHSAGNCLIETATKTLIVGCKNSSIPDDGSVTIIGDVAFQYCTSLTSIIIPNGIASIGNYAFSGCTSLKSIAIPDSVTSIGHGVFEGCDSLQYNVYDNANYLGNANNPYVVLMKAIDTSITSCNIHSDTKVIADVAFSGCTSLTSITIPDSVTSIGHGVFEGCDSLQYNVYDNANYLGNASNPYIVLRKVTDPSITSFDIRSDTKAIYDSAFSDCEALTSVAVPDSVTSIGNYVFSGLNILTSINYQGTKEEWNAVQKGTDWNHILSNHFLSNGGSFWGSYSKNVVVYCTDGEIDPDTLIATTPSLTMDEIDLSPIDGDLLQTYTTTETATDLVRMTISYTTQEGVKEQGDIYIRLFPEVAPITVANFKNLVGSGFYNGLTFHRIYPGFIIQGGDPKGDGTGGSETKIKGEFSENGVENNLSHIRGVISMARAAYSMNSASSQFFIMHNDMAAGSLDGYYASFGYVVNGMDIVDAITEIELSFNELGIDQVATSPVYPVTIESAVFVEQK